MEVTGNYRDLDTLIATLKQSPEAQRLIKGGFFNQLLADEPPNSAPSTAESEELPPAADSEKKPDSEQKTG